MKCDGDFLLFIVRRASAERFLVSIQSIKHKESMQPQQQQHILNLMQQFFVALNNAAG